MAENIRAIKLEYDLLVRDVPMRDGTLLDTMIYLPADRQGPFPVVLGRTPYSRADRLDRGDRNLLEQGIAVIRQGCRGTGASCGELFFQSTLLDAARSAAEKIAEAAGWEW